MRIPARIIFPVAGAIALVAILLVFLFLQLEGARALLVEHLPQALTQTGTTVASTSDLNLNTADESLLYLRQGDLHALRGEWALAAESYEKAANAGGGTSALKKLAQAQLQRRDVRGARDTLDDLKRAGGRAGDVLLLESGIYMRTGEITKARQVLEGAEGSPQRSYGLALLSLIAGDHEAAKRELLEVNGGWDAALRINAKTLLAAYDEYALFPDSPSIHLMTLLGRALAQVQECELALPLLSEVTHVQSDYRDAWIIQGFCELSGERYAEALTSLEQAYQIDPEKAEVQYFLARAYIGLEDNVNALTFLQYALRNGFQPETELRLLIADLALETGNASLAFDQYDALTQLAGASLETYVHYVTAALAVEKKQEALVKAEEAVAAWPKSAAAYDILGWAQMENGLEEEGRASVRKALEIDPNLMSAKDRLNID